MRDDGLVWVRPIQNLDPIIYPTKATYAIYISYRRDEYDSWTNLTSAYRRTEDEALELVKAWSLVNQECSNRGL